MFNHSGIPDGEVRRFLQSHVVERAFPTGVIGVVRAYRDSNGHVQEGHFAAPLKDPTNPRYLIKEKGEVVLGGRQFELLPSQGKVGEWPHEQHVIFWQLL